MTKIKKIFALLLMLTILLSLGITTALAAGEGTITVNGTTDGKTYDIYKIFDLTYSGTAPNVAASYTIDADWTAFFENAGAEYISNTDTGNLNPIVVNGTQKYINITEANIAEFSAAALAYAAQKAPDSTDVATGTTLVFDNLDLGYYLVYPQGASTIKDENVSICSLTSTVPNASVVVKASYPEITKTVDDETVDIGQTVTYTISGKVPDTTGYDSYEYTVSDTLSAGLTFNASVANFSVKINNVAVTTVDPVYDNNGFTIQFDMTDYQANAGDDIVISYSAVVNKDAVIGVTGNANTATLKYSNDPADATKTSTTPPKVVDVYTAAIEINKYDANDQTVKLENAKFVLQDNADKYYKFTAATDTTPEKVEWVTSKDEATVVTTDGTGKAYFRGVESGTYKLVETQAPKGYNMLTSPVTVEVDHTNQSATVFQIASIANSSGSVLPVTGGAGTTMFYIVGGIMMLGAVILLITKKKMSARDE